MHCAVARGRTDRVLGTCAHVVLLVAIGLVFLALYGRDRVPSPPAETARTVPAARTSPLTRMPGPRTALLIAALSVPQKASPDDTVVQHMEHRQGEEEPEGATDAGFWDRWSADLTIEWVSAYYYRGLLMERHGFILQPSFEVAYDLTAPESDLGVWVWGEMWNSLQSSATDANTSDWLQYWYEIDWYVGLAFEYDAWSLSVSYAWFMSPSNAFSTTEQIDIALGYDDSGHWASDFSLNPEIELSIETVDAQAGDDSGLYLQLGVAPSWPIELWGREIEVSVPAVVGLSLDNYYQNESNEDGIYGFFETGLDLSTQIGDSTTLYGSVHWLNLGTAAAEFNGDRNAIVGTIGVSFGF